MTAHTLFRRVLWPALCVTMTLGAALDYDGNVLAQHWDLPLFLLIGSFVPYALLARLHTECLSRAGQVAGLATGTVGLAGLAVVCILFDFSQFRPSGWVGLVFVGWSLMLFVLMMPAIAIDLWMRRVERRRENRREIQVMVEEMDRSSVAPLDSGR